MYFWNKKRHPRDNSWISPCEDSIILLLTTCLNLDKAVNKSGLEVCNFAFQDKNTAKLDDQSEGETKLNEQDNCDMSSLVEYKDSLHQKCFVP